MKKSPKRKRKVLPRKKPSRQATAAAVLDAIECITTVSRDSIKVTVDHGWARLEGTVHDWSQKETVDDVVRHVKGVKGVLSLLQARQ